MAAGVAEPAVAAAQATGIVEFMKRVLKTPYDITPMRALRCRPRVDGEEDEEEEAVASTMKSGLAMELLQRLEDSVGYLRGELGVCPPDARYITLHGGMGALCDDFVRLHEDLTALGHNGLLLAAQQVQLAQEEARQAKSAAVAMGGELEQLRRLGGSHTIALLQQDLCEVKADRLALEDTVLTLVNAVMGLMGEMAGRPQVGSLLVDVDERFKSYAKSVNGRLDSIHQEMKGGGIKVGGVTFSGQEAAMDWARIHLPPNTYQCIAGMIFTMCLISEAVVHQEDMMKRKEHGECVKCTFMQSVQVLSVHTSYPPMLDGVKSMKRKGGVDFLELKTFKMWKPVDKDGTSKKLEEGAEHLFKLITNTIESIFGSKPQARLVLLALANNFKMLFHELFALEVGNFYQETLNKVGGGASQ